MIAGTYFHQSGILEVNSFPKVNASKTDKIDGNNVWEPTKALADLAICKSSIT
jgi:hypothetical protein